MSTKPLVIDLETAVAPREAHAHLVAIRQVLVRANTWSRLPWDIAIAINVNWLVLLEGSVHCCQRMSRKPASLGGTMPEHDCRLLLFPSFCTLLPIRHESARPLLVSGHMCNGYISPVSSSWSSRLRATQVNASIIHWSSTLLLRPWAWLKLLAIEPA